MSSSAGDAFDIEMLGDAALLLRFGERIDTALNARVHRIAQALRVAQLPEVRDIVPAYRSIAVHYDPAAWSDAAGTTLPHARIAARLRELVAAHAGARAGLRGDDDAVAGAMECLEIPVCYGGEFGPDLADVATQTNLSEAEVVARHVAGEYRVAMLGFAPGFPYLLGLDARLHVPRRAHPRTRVPAGAVAIGGAQTGIYPRELPGGWRLIGRTPLALFDAQRDPPALLAPGQPVRFRAIRSDEFAALER